METIPKFDTNTNIYWSIFTSCFVKFSSTITLYPDYSNLAINFKVCTFRIRIQSAAFVFIRIYSLKVLSLNSTKHLRNRSRKKYHVILCSYYESSGATDRQPICRGQARLALVSACANSMYLSLSVRMIFEVDRLVYISTVYVEIYMLYTCMHACCYSIKRRGGKIDLYSANFGNTLKYRGSRKGTANLIWGIALQVWNIILPCRFIGQ